jgi:mono/diheme cytochrome c family protein
MRESPHRWLSVVSSVLLSAAALCTVSRAADAPAAATKKGGGGGRGPTAPVWWNLVDNGPFQADTILSTRNGDVEALKGLAIKLGPERNVSAVFDTELLAWRAGFDGVIQLEGTAWSGNHGGNSHLPLGESPFFFHNPTGLGWAINGSWADPRETKAGPLPRPVGRYLGLFRDGNRVVLHYTVAGTDVLELPAIETVNGVRAITRTIRLGAATTAELEVLVREAADAKSPITARLRKEGKVYLVGAPEGVTLKTAADGRMTVAIKQGTPAARFKIAYTEKELDVAGFEAPVDPVALTHGGPGLFPKSFEVKGQLDRSAALKTYAVDLIPLPSENPWSVQTRFGGFDFFSDGKRAACSSWNGDVWIAEGIDGDLSKVTWRRFAYGMYQTLGLKIVNDVVYTQGRDQITRLRDLNGDGEADAYECFNNDVQITSGFHEFTFDLQTDKAGNFYFSKAMPVLQGGRGFAPWTENNGTVMKVSPDGSKLEVVAKGFRAPGGVGVSPDGIVTTGENEGSWVPACKITWTKPGDVTFNGVVPSKWDRGNWLGALPGAPTDYSKPLCWLPYYADNSSGSQMWVPEKTTWDPRHAGELLHLSYGKSSVFRVLHEEVNGQVQGGAYRLNIDVSAAVMRARFHPQNGQLYLIGFRGWQTNGRDAFQRVRYTGVTVPQPTELHAHQNGLLIRFSAPLDAKSAEDPQRYSVSKWNYVWGPQYGSGRFSIDQRDAKAEEKAITVGSKGEHNSIDTVNVAAAKLLEDGRTVFLYIPQMTPAMQMELKLDLQDPKGARVNETIYHTVHAMAASYTVPGVRFEDIKVANVAPVGEPGLVLSFNSETTDAVRVDQLALNTPAGTPPSVFVAAREYGAAFQGSLIAPERDDYTFSLEGSGTASLQLDGKVVASGALPLKATAPVTLAKGAHQIFASFHSNKDGEGRIRLMWSSPQFRTEPVPASAFRVLPGAEVESWAKVRAGREIFAAAQCIRCHQPRGRIPGEPMPELSEQAPDLTNAGGRFESGWLEKWVAAPEGHCPSVATVQAGDVAAYLASLKDAGAAGTIATDAKSIAEGATLVEKLHLGFWIEPLTKERKHTDAGLVEQLLQPALHHPDTVFPDVRLTKAEAAQIAAYIRSKQPAKLAATGTGNATAGQAVVTAACASCHDPKNAPAPTILSLEEMIRRDWTVKGCVAENRGKAPDLHLSAEEAALLVGFRNADRDVGVGSLRRWSPAEYVQSQMKRLNCVQCHTGGAGESKVPDLTYVGEKLDRDWLTKLFEGKHAKISPWMEARMPAFASRAANLSLGLSEKHGVTLKNDGPAADAGLAATGAKVAGAEGYSCIACHDAGAKKALQVFEGQGPNLQVAGERLRYDYFQRWLHWPQRISPTTIMPRYTKDRDTGVQPQPFDGKAEQQFDAVWQWMKTLKDAPAK